MDDLRERERERERERDFEKLGNEAPQKTKDGMIILNSMR